MIPKEHHFPFEKPLDLERVSSDTRELLQTGKTLPVAIARLLRQRAFVAFSKLPINSRLDGFDGFRFLEGYAKTLAQIERARTILDGGDWTSEEQFWPIYPDPYTTREMEEDENQTLAHLLNADKTGTSVLERHIRLSFARIHRTRTQTFSDSTSIKDMLKPQNRFVFGEEFRGCLQALEDFQKATEYLTVGQIAKS